MKKYFGLPLCLFTVLSFLLLCNPSQATFKVKKIVNGNGPNICVIDRNSAIISECQGKNIFLTTDEGQTWTKVNSPVSSLDSIAISPEAVSFVSPSVGYVLGHTQGGTLEVYKTTNGGADFILSGRDFLGCTAGGFMHGMQFNRYNHDQGVIIGDTSREVYITNDGGATWVSSEVIGLGAGGIYVSAKSIQSVSFSDSSTIFLGGICTSGEVIFRSVDGGANWTNSLLYSETSLGSGNSCLVSAADRDHTYALLSTRIDGILFVSSSSGGGSGGWSSFSAPFEHELSLLYSLSFSNKNVGWASGVVQANPNQYPIIYRTLDGGLNWAIMSLPSGLPINTAAMPMACDSLSGVMYSAIRSNLFAVADISFLSNLSPDIVQFTPTTFEAGLSNVITITGENLDTSASLEIPGRDISVISTTISSSTELTAEVSVASNAAGGWRTITLRNPDLTYGTAEIYVHAATPVGSVEISTVNPGTFVPGKSSVVYLFGTGFDLNATLASNSSDVTLEAFGVQTGNAAKVTIYVNASTTLSSAKLKLTNPNRSSAEAIIVINQASTPVVKMTQINNNGSSWNPEKGPITVFFDGLPQKGRGTLAISSGFNVTRMPVDFASISANNNKQNLTKNDFTGGTPNGIYSAYLYSSDGKRLGKVKIVIFR